MVGSRGHRRARSIRPSSVLRIASRIASKIVARGTRKVWGPQAGVRAGRARARCASRRLSPLEARTRGYGVKCKASSASKSNDVDPCRSRKLRMMLHLKKSLSASGMVQPRFPGELEQRPWSSQCPRYGCQYTVRAYFRVRINMMTECNFPHKKLN